MLEHARNVLAFQNEGKTPLKSIETFLGSCFGTSSAEAKKMPKCAGKTSKITVLLGASNRGEFLLDQGIGVLFFSALARTCSGDVSKHAARTCLDSTIPLRALRVL